MSVADIIHDETFHGYHIVNKHKYHFLRLSEKDEFGHEQYVLRFDKPVPEEDYHELRSYRWTCLGTNEVHQQFWKGPWG